MKNIFDMIRLYRNGYYALMVVSLVIFSCLFVVLSQDLFGGNFNKIKLLEIYKVITFICAIFCVITFFVFRYSVKVTDDILKNGTEDVRDAIDNQKEEVAHINSKGEDVTGSINNILEDGVADRIDEFMIKNIKSNLNTFICDKEAKDYFYYMGKTKTGQNVYIMKH
ncbi:MAG: hypothetical protein K9L31_02135 [Candidatus Pacebacteria bacterium]|nr:hypothetical protein [Candidatus Paceibacterota bacterium]MCF7917324.1 hypothetical protein [Candidatus Omnitrophota bacterium]